MSVRVNVYGVQFRTRQILGKTRLGVQIGGTGGAKLELVSVANLEEAIQDIKRLGTQAHLVDIEKLTLSGSSGVRYELIAAATQQEAIDIVNREFADPKLVIEIDDVRTVVEKVLVPGAQEVQPPPATTEIPPTTGMVQ
jgi:hypothetical protein